MSNMNLFTWIRDGVRQSVLLGVSDAVEQLGTPAAAEDLHPSVVGFLNTDQSEGSPKITSKKSTAGGRKRLGKSLKEIGNDS
ncbi:MAG: hypothetical protein Aurels2KO_20050 [Aureliella sp.]